MILDALATIFDELARAEDSVHTRELRAQARTYDLAVKNWTTIPPGAHQIDAMFELVAELHARVVSAAAPRRSGAGR
jgi:hypothetical protein